jgi:hypothetical protein
MKYETPELTALSPAINAIQSTGNNKVAPPIGEDGDLNEHVGAYLDWE